jgi:hypothetical protein
VSLLSKLLQTFSILCDEELRVHDNAHAHAYANFIPPTTKPLPRLTNNTDYDTLTMTTNTTTPICVRNHQGKIINIFVISAHAHASYCHSHNSGAQNSFERFLVPVYCWKTIEKLGNHAQIF